MFSVAPNIVLAPNMTQNAERKHRTQDANTAPIRPPLCEPMYHIQIRVNNIYSLLCEKKGVNIFYIFKNDN